MLPTGAVEDDMCVKVRLPFLCGTVVVTFVAVDMELDRGDAEFLPAEVPELLDLFHCGIFPDYQHGLLQWRGSGLDPLPGDFGIFCLDPGEGFRFLLLWGHWHLLSPLKWGVVRKKGCFTDKRGRNRAAIRKNG